MLKIIAAFNLPLSQETKLSVCSRTVQCEIGIVKFSPIVLDLHGCIVTLDAMGTQKLIAEQIITQGGDYVLALKGNQGNLFEAVQQRFERAQAQGFQDLETTFMKPPKRVMVG